MISTSMRVLKIGMAGGLLITLGMMCARAIEVTPMNFELSLGALLTTQLDAIAWIVGFGTHLIISGIIAHIYAAAFRVIRRAGVGWGMLFGAIHWGVSGIAMGYMPRLFSIAPGIMESPGLFGANFGPVNFASNLAVHLFYGALVGGLYLRMVVIPARFGSATPGTTAPTQITPDKRAA